jgi:hypothetical protein
MCNLTLFELMCEMKRLKMQFRELEQPFTSTSLTVALNITNNHAKLKIFPGLTVIESSIVCDQNLIPESIL